MCLALAIQYRPFSFESIVGQRPISLVLQQMLLKEKIPTAMVFSGPRGSGKTSSARILGAAANCDIRPGPCGSCSSCIAVLQGKSLDVLEIDAATNGSVDDIRALRETVRYSISGRKRVVILDEAQSLTREAFSALLKMLEEPPPNTVFTLVTTEPRRIPDTVLSRCMTFAFRKLTIPSMIDRMEYICEQEALAVDPALLHTIAERADGGMRDAIMLLDQVTRIGVRTAEQFAELMDEEDFVPALLTCMSTNNLTGVLSAIDEQMYRTGDPQDVVKALVRCLCDLLKLKQGGNTLLQGDMLEVRRSLAARTETGRLVAALKVLWEVQTKIRLGDDRRIALELAAVVMTEILSKDIVASVETKTSANNTQRRLSLAEIGAM